MERLPGKERPRHEKALAVGVLRFLALCWWAYGRLPASLEELAETENPTIPSEPTGGGKRRPLVSWPKALRAVRGWLEPWIMLGRYWRAFTDLPPPKELRALLERVFAGEGIYLYVH
jgi:hypothetical protein